ncbi:MULTISPECIES: hypothetical protein [Kitasatospora]|uniref:hypothetical protein n=1 Tax=Kitasatospora TaxID=2063 RepID=UPI0031E2F4EF
MAPTLLRSEHPDSGPIPPPTDHSPVFVDQSGARGRRLRGFGWVVGLASAMVAAALSSSLIGMQSQAPALQVPPQPSSTIASPGPSGTGLPTALGSPMGSPPPATGSAPAAGPSASHGAATGPSASHSAAAGSAKPSASASHPAGPAGGTPTAVTAHSTHSPTPQAGNHPAKPQPTAQASHH